MKRVVAVLIGLSGLCFAGDKKEMTAQFKDKLFTVQRDGLFVGVCQSNASLAPSVVVKVEGDNVQTKDPGWLGGSSDGCDDVGLEPIRKGEIVRILQPYFNSHWARLRVETVTPHQFKRGVGAFEHSSLETGRADLLFVASGDYDKVAQEISDWLKPADLKELEAAEEKAANLLTVKAVKLGMSAEEVKEALGPPVAIADLGSKVLYKYKDMTVEFRDGKVADVR